MKVSEVIRLGAERIRKPGPVRHDDDIQLDVAAKVAGLKQGYDKCSSRSVNVWTPHNAKVAGKLRMF